MADSAISAAVGISEARVVSLLSPDGNQIDAVNEPVKLTGVPIGAAHKIDFELQPFDIFTSDARLMAMTDQGEIPIARPEVQLYRGFAMSGEYMFLSVSKINDADRWGVIWHDGKTSLLWPLSGEGQRSAQILVPTDRLPQPEAQGICGVDLLPENLEYLRRFSEPVTAQAVSSSLNRLESDLMVDISYGVYQSTFRRSEATATTYTANLFGAVSAIYERDVNVQLRISTLTVWTTSDPFEGEDSAAQLNNYRTYVRRERRGISRDLAHLLGNQSRFGGIAYLNGLCNPINGVGVSNIDGRARFPTITYAWDLNVVAHELGHGFGSPHTHCYDPPIDKCYGQEQGCYTGPSVATKGTIMSYCHLTSRGIDLDFHERVISVMRERSERVACIDTTEIAVDDGTAEEVVGLGEGGTVVFMNRLTPPKHPATLTEVAIYFGRAQKASERVNVGDPVTILVGVDRDGDGSIDGIVFEEFSGSVQAVNQFNVFDIPDLAIAEGDILVGFRMELPAALYPCGFDTSTPPQRRSYWSTDGVKFDLYADLGPDQAGNFMIRARLGQ